MATYATYRHIELDKVGYSKKRVRNPSSEILNVLYNPCSQEKGSRSYVVQARRSSHNDSFTRLFGSPDSKQQTVRRTSLSKHDVTNRNPVTGNGIMSYDSKPSNRTGPRIRIERNPITGEVYQIMSPATSQTNIVHQDGDLLNKKSSNRNEKNNGNPEKQVVFPKEASKIA